MMSHPLVSIIIPCFNDARYIEDSIKSALNQTYTNIEIIVVDDGSEDESEHIIRRFDGVHLIRKDHNGVSAARNTGFAASRGDHIVFLDSDDRLLPDAISTHVRAYEEQARYHGSHIGFVFGRFRRIASDARSLRTQEKRPEILTYKMLLRGDAIVPPGVALFPREIVQKSSGFNTSLDKAEDYDFYFRIAKLCNGYCHNDVTVEYRQHPHQTSSDIADLLKSTLRIIRSQKQYIGIYDISSSDISVGSAHWCRFFGQFLPIEIIKKIISGRFMGASLSIYQFLRHARYTVPGAIDYLLARLYRKASTPT